LTEADAISKIIRERAPLMAIADDGTQKALIDFVDDIRVARGRVDAP